MLVQASTQGNGAKQNTSFVIKDFVTGCARLLCGAGGWGWASYLTGSALLTIVVQVALYEDGLSDGRSIGLSLEGWEID